MDHVSSWLKNWYTSFTEMVHADYRSGTARLPNWYTVVTENWYTVGYRLHFTNDHLRTEAYILAKC
jgi:hypothetical protein